ncbi:hypothetical protein K2173_018712 [Erythroxylum novogranatense]|uniref:Uncharacterized protein n=1 Tax=Erythroxylum novogranatense TaxID=1862640 RepID=A0AAV8SB72_9ROSI|nr:hypothetical protein K2173_018712 [Erythroxylum novogranatense]
MFYTQILTPSRFPFFQAKCLSLGNSVVGKLLDLVAINPHLWFIVNLQVNGGEWVNN